MYVPYQCCKKSFEDYYSHQKGNGLNFYQGANFQRGYGFGGIFRSIFRAAVPLLKSGAKAIGKQLFHTGVDVLKDVSQGENLKVTAKRRLKEAGHHLTDKAAEKVKAMIGSGRKNKKNKKRKLSRQHTICKKTKKVKTHDIFS